MITKNILKAASTLIVVGAGVAVANASIDLNENARLDLRAMVSVEYNDNIYLDPSDKVDDVILHFIPRADLALGSEVAESSFRLSLSEDFSYYVDNDENNTQNTHFSANYNYAGAHLKASVAVGYDMMSQNSARDHRANRNSERGDLVRYDTWYARANGDYQLTAKLSATAGFNYSGKHYRNHRDSYADQQSYSIPVSLMHSLITEKLRGGVTYQYTYTDLARYNANRPLGYQETHFIGLNMMGEVSEKLDVNARIGSSTISYHRRNPNPDSSSTLSFSGTATYKATDKTTASLAVNRDFEISGTAQSIKSTGVSLAINHTIDAKWSAHENISWVNDDYVTVDRKDNIYTLGAGLGYRVNDYLSLGADYRFQWDDSDMSRMSYTNNVVTFSATARF